jgi:hypothetical protein
MALASNLLLLETKGLLQDSFNEMVDALQHYALKNQKVNNLNRGRLEKKLDREIKKLGKRKDAVNLRIEKRVQKALQAWFSEYEAGKRGSKGVY